MFVSQYFYIEKQLLDTFSFVSPSEKNKTTYSIIFASIIRNSANLFELISKTIYSEIFTCTKKQKNNLKIKNFLSLEAYGNYSQVKLLSVYLHDSFESKEVYEPFINIKDWDKKSEVLSSHIPKWWTANNKLKHSNTGLPDYGTLENAIAAVASVFVSLHVNYGPGLLWSADINRDDQIIESPKSLLFSPEL